MYMAMCIRRLALFPSGLTSWIFIASYTHKRPLCGHCASPLHEKANRSAPFGLDLLGLHGKIKSEFGSAHTFGTFRQIKGNEALL